MATLCRVAAYAAVTQGKKCSLGPNDDSVILRMFSFYVLQTLQIIAIFYIILQIHEKTNAAETFSPDSGGSNPAEVVSLMKQQKRLAPLISYICHIYEPGRTPGEPSAAPDCITFWMPTDLRV
jgi:hypothetical protein